LEELSQSDRLFSQQITNQMLSARNQNNEANKSVEQGAVANPHGAFSAEFSTTITSTPSFTIALSVGLAMLGRSAKNRPHQ
jgi:hypothetical protein